MSCNIYDPWFYLYLDMNFKSFYRKRLITFYCLSHPNIPCQISQEALWTLQQYFNFCLFVFMCVVHVCVCSRCQRTALSVFLQEFCQFNFKTFFSHWPVNCSMVSLSVQRAKNLPVSTSPAIGLHQVILRRIFFFNVLAHELRSSCL